MSALPQERTPAVGDVIYALESAKGRRDEVLRDAVQVAHDLAPHVIALVEKAADGVYLIPKQANLLFWGIHVLAAARCKALYRPLLRLVRTQNEDWLETIIGDAATETLPQLVVSTFDGDPAPLLEACSQRISDSFARWGLINALTRLTFDGAIPRDLTHLFLDRFEREPLADPGDPAWQGWADAICLLGLEHMRDRLEAACQDGRIENGETEWEELERQLTLAQNLAPGDPALFDQQRFHAIDDPAAALAWTESEESHSRKKAATLDRPPSSDPADIVALGPDEVEWLGGFLLSKHTRSRAMMLEQVDGFFCALICGPGQGAPSEDMALIWDVLAEAPAPRTEPDYDSAEQAGYVQSLFARHWNTIALRLAGNYPHVPVLEVCPGVEKAQLWASGFLRGLTLRSDDWLRGRDVITISGFIMALMGLVGRKEVFEEPLSARERADIVRVIPFALGNVHQYWRGWRDPLARGIGRASAKLRPGRNEPCPCGSGKKFKRCCGSPERRAVS